MVQEKGNISIHTENIFPIIKKFLYSDHEIFQRELVANAIDAKRLTYKGYGDSKPKVKNDSDANRAMNRRTEFKVIGKQ